MKTYQDELGYIRAGLEDGQAYLLSDQLFGMLADSPSSGGEYPVLTIGNLLLSLACSNVQAQTPEQQSEVGQVTLELERLRTRWRVAWGQKAAWEFRSRIKQWERYLNEVRQDSEKYAGYYRYEVRLRVILRLIADETDGFEPAYLEMLAGLDAILETRLTPGEFIWDAGLQPGFPKADYWFLYGYLRE